MFDQMCHDVAEISQALLHDLFAFLCHDAINATGLQLRLGPFNQPSYDKFV
jgi:hypothetical protein